MSNHTQTFRTLNTTKSSTVGIVATTLAAVLLMGIMIAGVLVFSWPANMEADYRGFGLMGAFAPVIAVIGAFFIGAATVLTLRGE